MRPGAALGRPGAGGAALDGAGRILVSPALRKFAGLGKQVMVVGQGSHFEIWDTEAWQTRLEAAMKQPGK